MKRAVQRVVRGEDGRIRSIYIDLETFQEVTNLEGYQVITGNTISNPEPVPSVEEPNTEPTGEIPEEPGYSSRGDRESNQYSNPNANVTSPSSARPSSNQGAPVGPVTRAGPVGPVTPADNLTRNPYEGQRDSAGAVPESTAPAQTSNDERTVDRSGASSGRYSQGMAAYERSYGPKRPSDPNQDVMDGVRTAVHEALGEGYSVRGTSGLGQHGGPAHRVGTGLDFDVIGPDGRKVTDAKKMNDVAQAYAAKNPISGVGFGTGYMTDQQGLPGRMHLDNFPGNEDAPRPANWGKNHSWTSMDPSLRESLGAVRESGVWTPYDNAPTPTSAPRQSQTATGFVSQDERVQDGTPTSAPSIYDAQQEQISGFGGTDVTGGSIFDSIGPTTANTPAALAAQGVRTRTPAEKTAIAKTLAGEMDRNTLDALAAGEQWAQQEFANMVTTIENRSTSKMFSTLGEALNPTHYNSLMASNLVTTEDNYQKYKGFIDPALDSFYAGGLIPTSWDYTSYFNPDLVSPKWATDLREPEQVGAHIFGSLPEYSANTAYRSSYALNSNPRPDNPAPGTDTDTGLGGMMGGNTPGGRRDSGSGGSGGYQSRGIANSVGGTSSIDNSPDDRDSGYSGSANGGRSSGSSGGFAGNSGGTPGSSPGGGWSSQSSGGSKSTSSGSKSSGTPGSSPGGGWGSQGKSTQSAHAAERERDDSL